MSELSIPSEFDLELRSERGRWLRRRLLWLCAVGILLTVMADAADASHQFAHPASKHHFAAWVAVVVGTFNVLLYAGAGLYAGLSNLHERPLLRLVFWLVIVVAATELIGERLKIERLFDPSVSPDPRISAAMVTAGTGLAVLAFDFGLACIFMPWTVREALWPAGVLLCIYSAGVVVDAARGQLPMVGLWTILGLAGCLVPGLLLCWWRSSRFHKGFRLRFESGRYRLLQGELASARRLHEASLPAPKHDGPIRLHYVYEPMRQLGGDLLYVSSPPGNEQVLNLVLLDVTGHGIAAALTVNRLIGELERLFGEHPDASPADILRSLNRYVAVTLARHTIYATALCLRVDANTGALAWANGGHPPAFVRRANGQLDPLDPTAPLLGAVADDALFEPPGHLTLGPDDVLIAYTDGLPEAANPDGNQLGTAGVRRLIAQVSSDGKAIREWPPAILRGVLNYRRSHVEDDTFVVALYLGK